MNSKFKTIASKYNMFLLLLVPSLTEYLENGKFPDDIRSFITDIFMTLLITLAIISIYRKNRQLENLSMIDYLTGMGNRHQFDLDIAHEVLRARRTNTGLSLIFFDLDGFKEINDKYGHEEGDKVLIQFAQGLSSFTREGTDSCYRFGGDEFAVLLTDINKDEIKSISNEIEYRLQHIVYDDLQNGVTASNGIVFLEANETCQELLKRADEAMYCEKRDRNNDN